MKRFFFLGLLAMVILTACSGATKPQVTGPGREQVITVYKSPTWGCCGGWTEYLDDNGFTVEVESVQNLAEVKARFQVPPEVQSCHTAIVGGYVIEGHVPIAEIERLLTELPDIVGIAVAGMPAGSPGMEIRGFDDEPFTVVAFTEAGGIVIFSSYPK